jgi:serine/threonine protein kinase
VVTTPDIPGHKVGGVLGRGGYATVYRAWQVAVGREVAVKVDNRLLLSDRDRRRFMREVTAAGRLSGHPHVVDVYDAGTLGDGRPYLVMELCPAGSLSDALRRHGPMSPARVRDIGSKIADALAAVCSLRILLASRSGRALRIPVSAWRVDVLPPSEAAFDCGTRTYRCVASVNTRQPRTSLFSR